MQFSTVIGQQTIKEQLVHMVDSHRVAHAQLFTGRPGVGKLALALAYAQYMCCEHRSGGDACGRCPSCIRFSKLAHPDLHFVFPIAKVDKKVTVCDNVVQDFREALLGNPYLTYEEWMEQLGSDKQGMIYTEESEEIIKKLNYKTYEAPYKVMIIWLPEKMHTACANKLLKIIEEPSFDTVLLMVSDEPDKLLPTIRSRVQQVYVPPIDEDELTEALQQRFALGEKEASYLSHQALGSYAVAKGNIEQKERHQADFDAFVQLMRLAWRNDYVGIRTWVDAMEKRGREGVKLFLSYSQYMVRESFVYKLRQVPLCYLAVEEEAFTARFSQYIYEGNVEQVMAELQQAEEEIEQNANRKIVLFDMALKLSNLIKQY